MSEVPSKPSIQSVGSRGRRLGRDQGAGRPQWASHAHQEWPPIIQHFHGNGVSPASRPDKPWFRPGRLLARTAIVADGRDEQVVGNKR